jgi:predicted DCC family thiol-disulfide oxidoreductase YuxK
MQLAEGRPLAEQLGINPDRPDSFAFVVTGQAYVKSEAALRIAPSFRAGSGHGSST